MSKAKLDVGNRVAGVRAESDWGGRKTPRKALPLETVVGEVRALYPGAPGVAQVLTDDGELETVVDVVLVTT